jgi:O-antigen/teichoic acid export membrane protein
MSLNRVIRGSFWLYVSGLTSNFLGYVYWLLASKFIPTSTVGDSAAVVAAVSLITSIFGLGLSSGATRLFGQAWGHNDRTSLDRFFFSNTVVNLAINGLAGLLVFVFGTVFGLTNFEIPYVTVFIILTAISVIPSSLFQSVLKTSAIALSTIISTILRLVIGIALLYVGMGFFGVMAGLALFYVAQDIILVVMLRGLVHRTSFSMSPSFEALKAGIPSWIPSMVSTAGTSLGVLGVYSLVGSAQAGTYYIAFSISQIVYTLPLSLLGLMFPVLSGMEDGRKRAINRSIRLVYVIIAPLAAVVLAYPYVPLSMLGQSYIASSLALQILMVGCFAAPISSGFNSLVYAYGKYSYVMLLGLFINLPRVFLYTVLVTLWGDVGAALSYVAGLFIVLIAIFFMARRIGYSVGWGSSLVFSAIPFIAAVLLTFTSLPWEIGTLIILAVSLFAYARLGLVTRSDLAEISSAFLSRKQLDSVYPYIKYILYTLYGE